MIIIVNFGSTKTPAIASCIEKAGAAATIIDWKNPEAADFASASGIIFGGSPTFFTEVDFEPYRSRYAFIKDGKTPTLGICFGHQLMGMLHGATIFRGEPVRTTIPIQLIKRDPLFDGLDDLTAMAEDHTEGISLPPSFIHLATSSSYTIEAMRHPALPLWGVQFHPEVSETNGQVLLNNFVKYCS